MQTIDVNCERAGGTWTPISVLEKYEAGRRSSMIVHSIQNASSSSMNNSNEAAIYSRTLQYSSPETMS